MGDIFKSRYFWEKTPFYKRKHFFIPALILVAILIFLAMQSNVEEKPRIASIVKFSEEVAHLDDDSEIFFRNISFMVNGIDKSYMFFNDNLGVGVKANGVFYIVSLEISNSRSKLENMVMPTITLVGNKGIYSRDKDAESFARNPLKPEEVHFNYSIKRIAIFDVPIDENVHLQMNWTGYRAILDG